MYVNFPMFRLEKTFSAYSCFGPHSPFVIINSCPARSHMTWLFIKNATTQIGVLLQIGSHIVRFQVLLAAGMKVAVF